MLIEQKRLRHYDRASSFFFVRVITYMFSSHSYISTDVISRHANTVEPLVYKDSTVLDQYAILDHLRPLRANLDAWS